MSKGSWACPGPQGSNDCKNTGGHKHGPACTSTCEVCHGETYREEWPRPLPLARAIDQKYSFPEFEKVHTTRIWVTQNNREWVASATGLTLSEIEYLYDDFKERGKSLTLVIESSVRSD